MRFSTVVLSSAFVLAGMSAAQFADSDFEVEARAFDEEPELYARGGAMSKLTGGNKKKDNPPSYRTAARDPPPRYQGSPNHVPHLDSFRTETDYSRNHKSPSSTSRHRRRSYSYDDGLVARGNSPSKIGGGDKERKDGKPPKYKVAAHDPPPRYQGSPHHVPHLDSFRTETDYSHNHKSPSGTQAHRHRRSFYDLD
ncbi:SCIV38 protein [Amanita muscaria]